MKYCKRCLYPENHALNIVFDKRGVCSGCLVHEEKYEIDWKAKELELAGLLFKYAARPGASYDCIIPVSGSGDDFFVVDAVKNRFGLNPLLVTYNTHFSTKVGVRNLARLITELDCDHMMSTVGPDTVREVTRITLRELGDMYWHVLAGTRTFPVQVATKLDIPLIIWGVNGWLDQVGMFSHHDKVEMTKKVRKEFAMRCLDAEELIGKSELLTKKDIQAFTYPSDEQLEKSRVRGIYLGNYVLWDSQKQIDEMIVKYGYETTSQDRTYNNYESIGCWNNASVHDYIKFLKFGYGKVSDHASRDIRLGRISREEGIQLVKDYQFNKPESLSKFLAWLGMTETELLECIDPFRDSKAWKKDEEGKWYYFDPDCEILDQSGDPDQALGVVDPREYQLTELMESESLDNDYILLGRTYMDDFNYWAEEG